MMYRINIFRVENIVVIVRSIFLRRYCCEKIIRGCGFPYEKHEVRTEDHYILELHRIPERKFKYGPILIVHGLLGSSTQWLVSGHDCALPYYLHQQGYDIWLANARGNYFSRKHEFLDPDKDAKHFYNYSWHEIGYYDWPAVIDYILDNTGKKDLFYIGHSQGCISFFVMAAERPEYNRKIRLMLGLAPVVYCRGVHSLAFRAVAHTYRQLEQFCAAYHQHEILPRNKKNIKMVKYLCGSNSIFQPLCILSLRLNAGLNEEMIDREKLPKYFEHTPSGSSAKQFLHYAQILNSDTFCQYDHGVSTNLMVYGQKQSPLYNLGNVTCPVALFYGQNDKLTTTENIKRLSSELKNLVMVEKVEDEKFGHIDFIFSTHAINILYPKLLNLIKDYS